MNSARVDSCCYCGQTYYAVAGHQCVSTGVEKSRCGDCGKPYFRNVGHECAGPVAASTQTEVIGNAPIAEDFAAIAKGMRKQWWG